MKQAGQTAKAQDRETLAERQFVLSRGLLSDSAKQRCYCTSPLSPGCKFQLDSCKETTRSASEFKFYFYSAIQRSRRSSCSQKPCFINVCITPTAGQGE